ncbi:MAG: hypothetical protein CMJ31_09330 [Phycisphaerae bacterium]|nr:hypothetical protein [Phycisphaerae bacterium]
MPTFSLDRLDLSLASLGGLAILLAAGFAIYVALLVAMTIVRFVRPPRRTYAWAIARTLPGDPREACDAEFEDVGEQLLPGEGIAAWSINGLEPDGPVIIASHGWGSGRIEMLGRLAALLPLASRVILWDMPGHGESSGVCLLGARASKLLGRMIDAQDRGVVLYGWSLGAEVSLLAARGRGEGVRGVVIEGAYRRGVTPAARLMRISGAPAGLNLTPALALIGLASGDPLGRFRDLADAAKRVGAPLLALHASKDWVSPPTDTLAIVDATGGRFVEIDGADHWNVWSVEQTRGVAAEAISAFVRSLRV